MLCRSCQEKARGYVSKRSRAVTAGRDQLCSRCGNLLGSGHMALRVQAKQSQLARFGLGTTRRPLLEQRKGTKRERS